MFVSIHSRAQSMSFLGHVVLKGSSRYRKFLTSVHACVEVTNITGHAHSRPQSPSFHGHVVGYKLSPVALGTSMAHAHNGFLTLAAPLGKKNVTS